MKKAAMILLVIIIPSICLAVGSWTLTSDKKLYSDGQHTHRKLFFQFTADTSNAGIPNLIISERSWSDGVNTGTFNKGIWGYFGMRVEIDGAHGNTEPTEDSDIYIWTPEDDMWDLLDGNGVNQVDNTDQRAVYFSDGVSSVLAPITDSLVVEIENNAVNSATGSVGIILVPRG